MAHVLTRREILSSTAAGLAALSVTRPAQVAAHSGAAPSALVTGCSSGFGRLTALALAQSGFQVFASMRDTAGDNAGVAADLRQTADQAGLSLSVIDLDVRDSASVEAAVNRAQSQGPLSVLVNNAGYILAGSIELHDEADVREQFETNIFGYHRLARAVLPSMRSRGEGLVVQVSSGLGRLVFPTQGWYVATKFAIEGMSEALAYELASFGVDLTIVQPTQYATQFLANGRRNFAALEERLDHERRNAYAQQIAMTRFGLQDGEGADPVAVAEAIRDLAISPQGSRPLRLPVSPDPSGLQQINAGLGAAQDAVFEGSPFAEWRAAVTD